MVKSMEIIDKKIDGGKAFDWGKTSVDYAKYRDIYPQEFYDKIINRNLCLNGQRVLDIGTGTGVIPRNMYCYGAKWTGTDISENQIEQAKKLSEGMDIDYYAMSAESFDFPDDTFDVIVYEGGSYRNRDSLGTNMLNEFEFNYLLNFFNLIGALHE